MQFECLSDVRLRWVEGFRFLLGFRAFGVLGFWGRVGGVLPDGGCSGFDFFLDFTGLGFRFYHVCSYWSWHRVLIV